MIPPVNLVPLLFIALFGWRVYRRARLHIGRQRVKPKRMAWRMGIFSVLAVVMGVVASWRGLEGVLGLGAGLLLGALLGWVGLRLTRFEATPEGRFYTPNTWIGVGLMLLLLARMGYRAFLISSHGLPAQESGAASSGMAGQSALTLLLFGVLAGYYIVYYAGVLLRCRTMALVPTVPNGGA